MIFVWIFMFVLFGVLGTTASFTGPLNVAKISGETVLFNCSTGSSSRLRWSTRGFGQYGEQQILTRENRILPNFESQYFVEANNGQLNLGIKHVTSSHAGRYICLELTTSKTASAELTVLESKPICNNTPSVIECDASYKGNLMPEFELKLQTINDNSKEGRLTRRLTLDGTDAVRSLNLSCVVSFSESNTRGANLTPENENGVTGTVAGNTPSLVSATECKSLTTASSSSSFSSIARVHRFELVAVAMTSIVYRFA